MKPAFLFTGNKASCDKWGALGKAEPALNRVKLMQDGGLQPLAHSSSRRHECVFFSSSKNVGHHRRKQFQTRSL